MKWGKQRKDYSDTLRPNHSKKKKKEPQYVHYIYVQKCYFTLTYEKQIIIHLSQNCKITEYTGNSVYDIKTFFRCDTSLQLRSMCSFFDKLINFILSVCSFFFLISMFIIHTVIHSLRHTLMLTRTHTYIPTQKYTTEASIHFSL